MPPEHRLQCPHCSADVAIRGARAFAPASCPACGGTIRARTDFAGYKLGDPIARSGLAMLFHATDPVTGVEFALKLIQPPFGTYPEDLDLFVEEVRVSAALEHPHLARVFGVGVEEGLAWIASELLTGGSLAGRLAAVKRLGEAETLTLGLQAASVLAVAAIDGLTHRDLEPNNLVFDEAATLKLTDFGQAVFYERLSSEVGIIWGRPTLVPPERLSRSDEDALADIYGLGATLFYALVGEPPYGGEANGQTVFDRMGNDPIRVENHIRPIHQATAAVLNRMLSASRARRFQSWEEVIEHLTRAHTEVTGRATPPPATPHPVRAPAPRTSPASASPDAGSPKLARTLVPDTSRSASLLTLAMLAAIVGVCGFFGWKYWLAPKPRLAASAPSPIPRVAAPVIAPPAAVTAPAEPPRQKSAVKPEVAAIDWSGWQTAMLESPKRKGITKGSADVVPGSGALRLHGNHTGIEGTSDECAFHRRELSGDWTLVARVTAHDGTAGLIAREGIGSGRPMLAILVLADGKVVAAFRRKADGKADRGKPTAAVATPWLKLARQGNVLAAHYSADGKSWRPLAELKGVPLPKKVPVGFVVWSGKKEQTVSATFERIALTMAK